MAITEALILILGYTITVLSFGFALGYAIALNKK